jgi:branched-chain amino acid aminotransferase
VAEGSGENIFMVRNGVLITPPEADDVLEGITRRSVIELAKDAGIPVEIRSVDRSELYIADELFFTGTAVQVAWIGKVDDRVIGDGKRGPITGKMQDLFFDIVHGKNERYKDWCTKILV